MRMMRGAARLLAQPYSFDPAHRLLLRHRAVKPPRALGVCPRAHAKPPQGKYLLWSTRRVLHRLGGPGQWSGWTPWKKRTSIASVLRARQLSATEAASAAQPSSPTARAENRRFGLLSTLRARAKLPHRADSLREMRWAPSRRGPARTAIAAGQVGLRVPLRAEDVRAPRHAGLAQGEYCHSTPSLAAIGCHPFEMYTVIFDITAVTAVCFCQNDNVAPGLRPLALRRASPLCRSLGRCRKDSPEQVWALKSFNEPCIIHHSVYSV